MTQDQINVAEQIRIRLRRDPGPTLSVDGQAKQVRFPPPSFAKLAPGLIAEVVVDLPDRIVTLPGDAWTGTAEELLKVAWVRTLENTPAGIVEVDVQLPRKLLAIDGTAPYITAFAMEPCLVLDIMRRGVYASALVAIPTPEQVLLYPFEDKETEGLDAAAEQLSSISTGMFDRFEEKRRISPHVYLSVRDEGFGMKMLR